MPARTARRFYLFGGTSLEAGRDGQPLRTYLRDAYVFRDGRWKRLADLPFPLAASPSPAATVKEKLIIFGGDDAPSTDPKSHPGFRDEMLEYDPQTDRWTIIGRMPAPRATTPVVFWNGGYVIVSGEIRRGVRSREVWRWTPLTLPTMENSHAPSPSARTRGGLDPWAIAAVIRGPGSNREP